MDVELGCEGGHSSLTAVSSALGGCDLASEAGEVESVVRSSQFYGAAWSGCLNEEQVVGCGTQAWEEEEGWEEGRVGTCTCEKGGEAPNGGRLGRGGENWELAGNPQEEDDGARHGGQ